MYPTATIFKGAQETNSILAIVLFCNIPLTIIPDIEINNVIAKLFLNTIEARSNPKCIKHNLQHFDDPTSDQLS